MTDYKFLPILRGGVGYEWRKVDASSSKSRFSKCSHLLRSGIIIVFVKCVCDITGSHDQDGIADRL